MKNSRLQGMVIIILFISMLNIFSLSNDTIHDYQQKRYPVHRIVTTFDPLDAEIFIESDADLEGYGFPGNGTENNPYRIENYTFDTFKQFGILIMNTTKHVIVQNNSVSASDTALKAEFNAPGTLSFYNNTCKSSAIGLCAKFTARVIIQNNTVYDNEIGINMENNNSYSFVRYNDLWGNNESLLVINTQDVQIVNNTIRNNNFGIVLRTMNETIPTVNCSIIFNLFENNTGYGVFIPAFYEHRWSQENSIHHNTFANNNADGKKQALDDGVDNEWDDGEYTGNYWSDWWGLGAYNIEGLAKSKDRYPLDDPLHEVTTKIPGIFKGRILVFTIFAPILLGGYIFVQTRKRRIKIKENEKK